MAFYVYVCGSKLKHLAVNSAVASHFAEARVCVSRVLFFLPKLKKVILKMEKKEKVNIVV